ATDEARAAGTLAGEGPRVSEPRHDRPTHISVTLAQVLSNLAAAGYRVATATRLATTRCADCTAQERHDLAIGDALRALERMRQRCEAGLDAVLDGADAALRAHLAPEDAEAEVRDLAANVDRGVFREVHDALWHLSHAPPPKRAPCSHGNGA